MDSSRPCSILLLQSLSSYSSCRSGGCDERPTGSTLRGCSQQNPGAAGSKRVCPHPEPWTDEKSGSVVAEAGSPKRSRHLAPKVDNKCLDESAPEGVDGEDKFTHKTSMCGCDVEIWYHGKSNILSGTTARTTFKQDRIATCLRATYDHWWRAAAFGNLQWMSGKKRSDKTRIRGLECLPFDVLENVFRRLELKDLCRSKILSKSSKALLGNESFLRSRGASGEGLFTAINFFIKDKAWQCTGLDLLSTTWRRLPTFSWLPTPDPTLFKEYLVCGNGALMCANVSKSPHKEYLVVFNLLTGETRHLPSLNYPRNPVLIHILVDPVTNAYKVVAAGCSSSSGEENLSRRVEVYDSQTLQWEVAKDIPGPEFGLNEHQTGVCIDGILYFVAFLEDDGQKGVAAFNVKKGEWLKNKNCSLPCSLYSNILQLVESSGNIYLFSEQEHGGIVEHCIDVLDFFSLNGEETCQLKTLIRVKKSGGRGLLVYPEYICVPYGKRKLCVFNTIKRDGVVYDIQSGMQCEELEPPPESQRGVLSCAVSKLRRFTDQKEPSSAHWFCESCTVYTASNDSVPRVVSVSGNNSCKTS